MIRLRQVGEGVVHGVARYDGRRSIITLYFVFPRCGAHVHVLGLNPSFSANSPYRSLSFVSKIHYMDFPDSLLLLLSISVFLLFSFFLFLHFFSCRFRTVD